MSVVPTTTKGAEPLDRETPTAEIRYSFKTTIENKTEAVNISIDGDVKEELTEMVMRSARWRSVSQFITDAFVYYLNQSGTQTMSVLNIIEDTEWSSENQISASITQTLFNEIDVLVNHCHTPWHSKQAFYICAIRSYNDAQFPAVEQR